MTENEYVKVQILTSVRNAVSTLSYAAAFDSEVQIIVSRLALYAQQLHRIVQAFEEGESQNWKIYMEGWASSDGKDTARLAGMAHASSFAIACKLLFHGDKNFDPENLTLWGCRLFDNEKDARKSFG